MSSIAVVRPTGTAEKHTELSRALHARLQEDTEELAETWERVIRMCMLTQKVRAHLSGALPRLHEFTKFTLLPGDPMPPYIPTYISKFDMAQRVTCTVFGPDAPLMRDGWDSWLAAHSTKSRHPIIVLRDPPIAHGETHLLARQLTRIIPSMAFHEANSDPAQFHGWFPSNLIHDMLTKEGASMTQEVLSKAASLVQVLPIHPDYPRRHTVPMLRIFKHVMGSQTLYFAALHPSLKVYA